MKNRSVKFSVYSAISVVLLLCVSSDAYEFVPTYDFGKLQPILYSTEDYGIFFLDLNISASVVGDSVCNTTALAQGIILDMHYTPILSCGVQGQLILSDFAVVSQEDPLLNLTLTWTTSFNPVSQKTLSCVISNWNPTDVTSHPSCEIDYSLTMNYYSFEFTLSSWGGYVNISDHNFNVSVVAWNNSEVYCKGWNTTGEIVSSNPFVPDKNVSPQIALNTCDYGTLYFSIFFDTQDINVIGIEPTWTQNAVPVAGKQHCYFQYNNLYSSNGSCTSSFTFQDLTYDWTYYLYDDAGATVQALLHSFF